MSPRSSASCRARFPQSVPVPHPSVSRDVPRQPHVRLCQLATGRERLEHGDSFASGPPRLLRPSRAPEDIPKSGQRASFPELVAEGTTALERLLKGGYRLVALVGQVALVRTSLEHVGALVERQSGPEPEDAAVLGGGLAVGAHRACSLSGREGEADDSVGVPGRLGVVGQASEVQSVAWPTRDGAKGLTVQASFIGGANRALQAEAGELVPENYPVALRHQHAGGDAFVHGLDRAARQGLEQPQLGSLGYDRRRLEELSCSGAEPHGAGQHGVLYCRGDHFAPAGEDLCHEERVAPGLLVQFSAVDAARRCQLAYCVG